MGWNFGLLTIPYINFIIFFNSIIDLVSIFWLCGGGDGKEVRFYCESDKDCLLSRYDCKCYGRGYTPEEIEYEE